MGTPGLRHYVAGFLIDESHGEVALIRKNRPAWQAGKLNGIGGKVEPGETPHEAMRREFVEEAGLDVTGWHEFCELSDGKNFVVHFFRQFFRETDERFTGMRSYVSSQTDEKVAVLSINQVKYLPHVPNLAWLIPMARSMDNDRADKFYVTEWEQPELHEMGAT